MYRIADKLAHLHLERAGDRAPEPDFLVVCIFSLIGLLVSFHILL